MPDQAYFLPHEVTYAKTTYFDSFSATSICEDRFFVLTGNHQQQKGKTCY